jgi:hypothetical protein
MLEKTDATRVSYHDSVVAEYVIGSQCDQGAHRKL